MYDAGSWSVHLLSRLSACPTSLQPVWPSLMFPPANASLQQLLSNSRSFCSQCAVCTCRALPLQELRHGRWHQPWHPLR